MEEIASELESAKFRVFLPHRDAGLVAENEVRGLAARKKTFTKVFSRDLAELEKATCLVCLLDGLSFGTSLELGYACALRKSRKHMRVVGLYTDLRGLDSLDLMRTCACDRICTSKQDLIIVIKQLLRDGGTL
jgi:nucleoside 2-deoxyribosyltransferase